MKILKIRCLVFNLFRLIITFLHGHVAPLAPLYEGPYKVSACSLKNLQLQVGKRVEVVSVQRLKPAFTADYEVPEAPPCCGRAPHAPVPPIPLEVEDSLGKLLQNPPPLLCQRGKK